MFVNLEIKSKNQNSLNQFVHFLLILNDYEKLGLKTNYKYFKKPKRNKIFTILQSPHVNKISQEQFEYNLTSKQYSFMGVQLFKLIVVIKKVQKVMNFDVKIIFEFIINVESKKINKLKTVNPQNYILNEYKMRSSSTFKQYLKLFDAYGNLRFCLDSSVGRAKD